jgi:hypothetical protein
MLKNILPKFLMLLLVLALCSCAKEQQATGNKEQPAAENHQVISVFNYSGNYNTNSPIRFPDTKNYWNYIETKNFGDIETYLFLPKGEKLDNWTEKLTVDHYLSGKPSDPTKYLQEVVWPEVVDQCYLNSPNLQIISKSSKDIVFTYSMQQCGKNVNQVVVSRIIKSADGIIYAMNYALRTTALNDVSLNFIVDFLNSATLN